MIKNTFFFNCKNTVIDIPGYSKFLFEKENAIINGNSCFIGTKRGNRSYRLVEMRYMKIDYVYMYNNGRKGLSWF